MTARDLDVEVSVRCRRSLIHGEMLVVEAYLGETRVSRAHVMRPYRRHLREDSWWIMDLHTRGPFRRMGFGRRVVQECLTAAQGRGIDTLLASVDERNEASRGLFESVGFERVDDPALEKAVSRAHNVLLFWPPRLVIYSRPTMIDAA